MPSRYLRASPGFAQALAATICMASHWLISPASAEADSTLLQRHDGFVAACGAIIYYETIGNGRPLMVLHGGPGLSHTYFLPYLLPLAKHHRLIFLDERGSGRSQRLTDLSGYTLENMACDANAVRLALGVKTLDVMGHSFGGILAQEYAIKYPSAVRRLVLASTWSSASRINQDFSRIKNSIDPELRARIETMEQKNIIGSDGAQLPEYRKLADEAEAPYNFVARPPAWDGRDEGLGWDVLITMWGGRSDFHIDGNLAGLDFVPQLRNLKIPTLIIFGDHDLLTAASAAESRAAIRGSKMITLTPSGHMTFVDQTTAFLSDVETFLDD
jgi:proline iminopeptidase